MITHNFQQGRALIQALLEAWPAPRCDATDGARLYLAYSCRSCGSLVWPEDEYAPVHPNQIICESCLRPNVLTFPDGELLVSTLQELVFAWPAHLPAPALEQAQRFLLLHAIDR